MGEPKSEYVDINGHPTWLERNGAGDTVLVLHGGFTNSDGLFGVLASLAEQYQLVAFDRRGHGRTADTDAPFHYDDMARQAVAVIEHVGGGAAHVVGYSDGGVIALVLARTRPDLVRSLVLIGTNFHYDGIYPGSFDDVGPESELFTMLQPAYAERSPDGADHFNVVVAKEQAMYTTEPTMTPADLGAIEAPALVIAGDDDAVTNEHTWTLYESLAHGQLAVIPGTSHLVPYEKPQLVVQLITDFLESKGDVATMMPLRRAGMPLRRA